jgi:hypothetical protein
MADGKSANTGLKHTSGGSGGWSLKQLDDQRRLFVKKNHACRREQEDDGLQVSHPSLGYANADH